MYMGRRRRKIETFHMSEEELARIEAERKANDEERSAPSTSTPEFGGEKEGMRRNQKLPDVAAKRKNIPRGRKADSQEVRVAREQERLAKEREELEAWQRRINGEDSDIAKAA